MSGRSPSLDSRLLNVSGPARLFLVLTVAAGFIATVIAVAQALLLSTVVSRVFIEGQTLNDLPPLLLIMLALAFARATIVWSGDLLGQRSASHLKGVLRARLTERLLALGPAFTRGERSGELVNTAVQAVEDLDEYVVLFQPMRILAVLVPVFVAGVVLAIDPPTVLILLVTGPLLLLLLTLIGSRAGDLTRRRFLELGWMSANFLDILQGLATLKMFGRSREQIETIRDVGRHYAGATQEVLRTAFETALVLEWSTAIATALVAVEISLRLVDGGIPFERALAVLIITPEFFLPLRQLSSRYHAGAAGKAAAERIFAVLDAPASQGNHRAPTALRVAPPPGDIHLDRVWCSYDAERRPALRDLSLLIPRGQRVALVGTTGAGKTTVANLLLRFVEPESGSITVDGASLSAFDPAAWRSHVACVPQQPHLFYGTVAGNIRLARPAASHDEVVAAASAAHAHDFITRLPHGYDTPVGERGARLSGGEQQRLAIARAFLKDAPFLIIDEATSHLDVESEALLLDAMERLLRGRTVLIIAHRLRLAHAADQVVVMHEGRAIESGTHESLLAKGEMYRALATSYDGAA